MILYLINSEKCSNYSFEEIILIISTITKEKKKAEKKKKERGKDIFAHVQSSGTNDV